MQTQVLHSLIDKARAWARYESRTDYLQQIQDMLDQQNLDVLQQKMLFLKQQNCVVLKH